MPALLGRKVGMTQVFQEDGRVERVTVVEAGPCPVLAIRTFERDGYEAVQLGFGEVKEKRLTKAQLGHLKKADAPPVKHLCEFRDEAGELQVGDTVTVEAFEKGQRVKVAGVSKGKGFQGTVKRHNFSRGPVTHGSHNVRAPGSIGASATPSRVFKGIRGPGQMGNKRVTQKGLEVVDVLPDQNLLLLRGSVPGSKGKGFQGTVKRHNFSRGPVSHGSHNVRAPGSIGASATPSRVFKGIRGPGQMGNKRATQKGLEVVDVLPDRNLLLLRGSVPGHKGSTVEIRTDS